MAIESSAAPFLAARGVILFDVPGVPGARLVLRIEPELVAAPGERLALRGFVDEAGDRPVVADLDPQRRVFEPALVDRQARRAA